MATPLLRPRARKRLLVMLVTTLVLLVGCELGFRLLAPALGVDVDHLARVRRFVREGSRHYEPRPHTSFGLRRHEYVNSLGFMGPEWRLERTPGVPRILCVGGSTTQGGNLNGLQGAYPWLLEQELERRAGRDFEVLNAGVSGWTTAETVVTWFLLTRDFDPDLVVVHHGINDVEPRTTPGFRPDYLHWRTTWSPPRYSPLHVALVRASHLYAWLTMSQVEVDVMDITTVRGQGELRVTDLAPETAAAFRRNVETLGDDAVRHGVDVMLMTLPLHSKKSTDLRRRGVDEHNRIARELCREKGWMLADAAALLEGVDQRVLDAVFLDGVHVHVPGNRAKARVAADVLMRSWVPSLPPAPGGAVDGR